MCFLECKQRAASCGKSKPCCSAAWQTGTSGLSCTMRARSSFVLPPTPGNETKSPERNFHPRLIMKRISLITLVDCGHCSASFSKKKRRKKLLKVFQCIALIVSQAECKSIRYIFFSVPIYCIAQFCLFYFPALDFCSCLCLQQSLQLTLKGISQLCSWYKYFFIAPESLTQLMIEYFPV